MARIVSIEEGADGTAKAVSEDGSLFRFKLEYLLAAYDAASLDFSDAFSAAFPVDLDDDALSLAVEALEAESRALGLLARAEQYRLGLQRKLAARGMSKAAIALALDALEAAGLVSDLRYASSWMRQRLRSRTRPEGPRSLSATLSGKGIGRNAIGDALAETLDDERRLAAVIKAAVIFIAQGYDRRKTREGLIELGWKMAEADDALDAIDGGLT